ncbi:hypothetical protein Cgig2_009795 [Carnegiea gigantea]|uniref:Uncharacterized protein n=1 Tax=Carnegiea gigantea TaxID=171969 RepID=A0A9Q1GGA4_9CARY|nr:hypothetical protein Cgig2_009795 [Carnegiea gigantea]
MPFRYLGVPITANKLSKLECSVSMEKFTRRITTWAIRTISCARKTVLINSVLMGVFNFWAKIFIIPKGVIKELERLCRNYLWGADDVYKRIPYILARLRKNGGLGIRNMEVWNKACIAKLVWAVAKKKDLLWVKWYWGKLFEVKEEVKWGCSPLQRWKWNGNLEREYNIQAGYKWYLNIDLVKDQHAKTYIHLMVTYETETPSEEQTSKVHRSISPMPNLQTGRGDPTSSFLHLYRSKGDVGWD